MTAHAEIASAKNREIEVLRALAILLTLAQHLPILLPWPNPPAWVKAIYDHTAFWVGVDLFFVISGFVVTQSLLNAFAKAGGDSHTRWREVKRFWVRRAFRLFPMAWLGLIIVMLATAFFNSSGVFGALADNAKQSLWIFFYAYNWIVYPLFAEGTSIAALGVFWSLATEEQFYVLLPLLLLLLKPRGLMFVLFVAIAAQFFIWRPAPWTEPFWGLRFEALAWGVLLAFFAGRSGCEKWEPVWLTSTLARTVTNLLLLAAIVCLPAWLMHRASFGTGVLAIFCAIWIWLAGFSRGYVMQVGATSRALEWLGARSYAIYVLHVPGFMFTRELALRFLHDEGAKGNASQWNFALATLAFGVGLVLLVATICHRVVERPWRESGRRIALNIT